MASKNIDHSDVSPKAHPCSAPPTHETPGFSFFFDPPAPPPIAPPPIAPPPIAPPPIAPPFNSPYEALNDLIEEAAAEPELPAFEFPLDLGTKDPTCKHPAWQAGIQQRARAGELDALIQLNDRPISNGQASHQITLGDLLSLVFHDCKAPAPSLSSSQNSGNQLLQEALLASADEAKMLSALMETVHPVEERILARVAGRIQARNLLAIELDCRIVRANLGR